MNSPSPSGECTFRKTSFLPLAATTALVIAAPIALGHAPPSLLELPPRTSSVAHAPFSAAVFVAAAVAIGVTLTPVCASIGLFQPPSPPTRRLRLSRLGWLGIALCGASWVIAWTRFPLFAEVQLHTFFPLWLGYILAVGELASARELQAGCARRPLSPVSSIGLFAVSALFWWLFEYLNRFVENWSYINVEQFSALSYSVLATVSFSTVLPAVLVTRRLLGTFERLNTPLTGWRPVRVPRHSRILVFTLALVALIVLPIFPNELFPFVWAAPLALLAVLISACGGRTALDDALLGDWRPTVHWAIAALVCGWFWEMWNWQSLARWTYAVPYVGCCKIFEMPLIGFAGYIPFGVLCGAVCESVLGREASRS